MDHSVLAQRPELLRGRGLGERKIEIRTETLVAVDGSKRSHGPQSRHDGQCVKHLSSLIPSPAG
ncbi:hypothetical protein ACFXAZ_13320 [Streptomyces sp. NPDC059477]|uniref:hypothetical protein n=1 Tax=Streptomyces sp. NPDC059477 TaxID=3346847 RepID=UPI0036A54A5F